MPSRPLVLSCLLAACASRAPIAPGQPAALQCGPAWMLVGDAVDARGPWVALPLGENTQVAYDDFTVLGTRTCQSADLMEARFEVRSAADDLVVARPKVLWRRNDVAAACFTVEAGAACISVCAGEADCDRLRGVR